MRDKDTLRGAAVELCHGELRLARGERDGALAAGDVAGFGKLMNDSHDSLMTDYEVSSDRLDRLVTVARRAGALGARLTGAGFGGCVVMLVEADRADAILKAVLTGCDGAWLVDRIGA